MNPHWIQTAYLLAKKAMRVCPHCGKKGTYPAKKPGQFHTCKHCHHRFKEKER